VNISPMFNTCSSWKNGKLERAEYP